ncbi:GSCOCG00007638001-RA-CDS, partial [Cotesia congregata]
MKRYLFQSGSSRNNFNKFSSNNSLASTIELKVGGLRPTSLATKRIFLANSRDKIARDLSPMHIILVFSRRFESANNLSRILRDTPLCTAPHKPRSL